MAQEIGFIYFNGLGNGQYSTKDRAARAWWRQRGIDLKLGYFDWTDPYTRLEHQAHLHIERLLKEFGHAAIIGGSAGGSLALNTFASFPDMFRLRGYAERCPCK